MRNNEYLGSILIDVCIQSAAERTGWAEVGDQQLSSDDVRHAELAGGSGGLWRSPHRLHRLHRLRRWPKHPNTARTEARLPRFCPPRPHVPCGAGSSVAGPCQLTPQRLQITVRWRGLSALHKKSKKLILPQNFKTVSAPAPFQTLLRCLDTEAVNFCRQKCLS